jgi:hypothetical protein
MQADGNASDAPDLICARSKELFPVAGQQL